MNDLRKKYDIVIVGGGLVGMSLALGLGHSHCHVLLIEQNQSAPCHDNVMDLRTTGLTRSSEKMFSQLGVWSQIAKAAYPIERLDISEQGNFGAARINASEHGLSPIGYMVPNHHLNTVLSDEITRIEHLTMLSPASCQQIYKQDDGYQIEISHEGQDKRIHANLLVGADGAKSKVRELLNISSSHKKYQQSAIITNIETFKPHLNIAYERFTRHGPLAVLPIEKNHCALIWTQHEKHVNNYLKMDNANFLHALQKAFGYRLGKFMAVGRRAAYPLSMTSSDKLISSNAVLIGNAAQTVHPVAAQGFNLGLRDVHTLIHMLKQCDFNVDQYSHMLTEYEQQRLPDRQHVINLTDGLTRLFTPQIWPAKLLRSLGVRMIGSIPAAQRSMLIRNMGMRYLLEPDGEYGR